MKKITAIKYQKQKAGSRTSDNASQWPSIGRLALTFAICLLSSGVLFAGTDAANVDKSATPPTLEETRLTMDKWLETQQIISRERKDWQQGKEILLGRLELVKREIATLEEKTRQAESSVAEADKKRSELLAENDQLKTSGAQLTAAAAGMESEVRKVNPCIKGYRKIRPRPTLPQPSGFKIFSASLTN